MHEPDEIELVVFNDGPEDDPGSRPGGSAQTTFGGFVLLEFDDEPEPDEGSD